MATLKMTKEDFPQSFGAFKPIKHVVVALEDDDIAQDMAEALRTSGFDEDEVLTFSARDMAHRLHALEPQVSGAAAFGSEASMMRHYEALAEQGCGWVIVYVADEPAKDCVQDLAERFEARLANKYNLLTVEDLMPRPLRREGP